MQGENMELLWYAFWFTKGMILLIPLCAAALFSKWLLRHILRIRIERRSRKHAIALSLGTLPPPRATWRQGSRFVESRIEPHETIENENYPAAKCRNRTTCRNR